MYWLGKASHFNNLKRVIFGPIGGQKLGNARNSNKAKSGVSQIHLWQLFHFINVRCNYCLQLSLSYPRFLQTGLNRIHAWPMLDRVCGENMSVMLKNVFGVGDDHHYYQHHHHHHHYQVVTGWGRICVWRHGRLGLDGLLQPAAAPAGSSLRPLRYPLWYICFCFELLPSILCWSGSNPLDQDITTMVPLVAYTSSSSSIEMLPWSYHDVLPSCNNIDISSWTWTSTLSHIGFVETSGHQHLPSL